MKLVKIAGAALNQTPLDWEGNLEHVLEAIGQAKAEGVSVLCLPELCLSGYGCEDMFYAPGVHQTSLDLLHNVLPHTEGIVVSVGLPVLFRNRVFNTACLMADGRILGFSAKQRLAGDGIHYEPRWFTPWAAGQSGELDLSPYGYEGRYPIGDLMYNVGGIRVGFEICEDAWVPDRPGRNLFRYGVDLVLNPSASHFAFDKLEVRKRIVCDGSRAMGAAFVYANLVGNEAGRAIYDGGTLIASAGKLLAVGPRLTFGDVLLTTAVIDVDLARMAQSQSSASFDLADELGPVLSAPFIYAPTEPEPLANQDLPWEHSPRLREEEFSRAVALGMFDYMRKSRTQGFVVSLSGGADSAAVACIAFLMIKLGVERLSLSGFKRQLSYIRRLEKCQSVEELARELITTAYQPTENSGEVTRNAAQAVAEAIGATHHVIDVDGVFKGYVKTVEDSLGRALTWEQDDIALQNIQSRVRAPSVWMLANVKGALLLSTSNRSEAAVGYATMDGDTSGGLSPIAGIDKAFLRQWLRWLETEGVDGQIRLPDLKAVNAQQPTAELRPKEAKQTDEDDLMPYDVLEAIEKAAIRDKKTPLECFRTLRAQYSEAPDKQLVGWVGKFFRLWSRNQWKRERYAPSFHLDDKNLDPKTWCRFPILSGGFRRELQQLKALEAKSDSASAP